MGFSLGSVVKGVGGILGFAGEQEAGDAARDQADRQAAEAKRVAEENKEISLYDASVMEKDAIAAEYAHGVKLQNQMRAADLLLGKGTARLGKSGVSVSEGSALDAQVEIVREARRESDIIVNDGVTARERRRSAAERYRLLADKGLRDAAAHASILESAGAAEQSQHQLASYGQLLNSSESIYSVGESAYNSEWFQGALTSIGSYFGGGSAA
jgi:hypothetical protein